MMSVEGNEINIYQVNKMQMLEQLQAQVANKLKQQQAANHEQIRSHSQSQRSGQPQEEHHQEEAAEVVEDYQESP